ncbi:MAG: hypothetical protein ACJA08_000587 [Cyclobacteriaceae bacterium]|jgi:hypothetical protein
MKILTSIILGILLILSCEDDAALLDSIDYTLGDTLSLKIGQKAVNEETLLMI